MKIVEQSHEIRYPYSALSWEEECKFIEFAGRVAYKSEDKITDDSYKQFITEKIIKPGHLAVVEFGNMIVKFVTDRGISHELVRHRLCSFVQESTRYCNYSSDKFGNECTFIKPSTWDTWTDEQKSAWRDMTQFSEDAYTVSIQKGGTPQQARSILPNSLKTEIVVKANFREWRHIFALRAISKAAHPDMRALMLPLYEQCRKECPVVFDMGDPE